MTYVGFMQKGIAFFNHLYWLPWRNKNYTTGVHLYLSSRFGLPVQGCLNEIYHDFLPKEKVAI